MGESNLKNTAFFTPYYVNGILLSLVATGLFAVVASMAKYAVTEFHVLQILFFRQTIVLLSSLPKMTAGFPQSLKTQNPGKHAARLLGAFIALSFGIWSVSVLPLTTAITLSFVQIFFVAVLAAYFLGEPVGVHRIGAIIVGFIGVLVVMRPGVKGLIDVNALIPIGGAMGAAVAVVTVRKLSQTETTAALLFYQALFIGLLAGLPMLWLWKTPNLFEFGFLIAMGIVATAAQWIGVAALRHAEASVIGNIQYTSLIYGAVFGYFFFNELPDVYTICGATIIVASAVYIVRREVKQKKKSDKHMG